MQVALAYRASNILIIIGIFHIRTLIENRQQEIRRFGNRQKADRASDQGCETGYGLGKNPGQGHGNLTVQPHRFRNAGRECESLQRLSKQAQRVQWVTRCTVCCLTRILRLASSSL